MVKIEFFLRGKSLGEFPLKDGLNHEDREEVAKVNGIKDFDRFILDDGRVTAARISPIVNRYTDSKGDLWLTWWKREPIPDRVKHYPMTKDEAYQRNDGS